MKKIDINIKDDEYDFFKNLNKDEKSELESRIEYAIDEFICESYSKYEYNINSILKDIKDELLKENEVVYESINRSYILKEIYKNSINLESEIGLRKFKDIVLKNINKFFYISKVAKEDNNEFPF